MSCNHCGNYIESDATGGTWDLTLKVGSSIVYTYQMFEGDGSPLDLSGDSITTKVYLPDGNELIEMTEVANAGHYVSGVDNNLLNYLWKDPVTAVVRVLTFQTWITRPATNEILPFASGTITVI